MLVMRGGLSKNVYHYSFLENIISDIKKFYICPDFPVDIIRIFLISDFPAEGLKANKN